MSEMDRIIKTCIEARIPVIGTGPPGTGKTGYGLDLQSWPCPHAEKGHYVMQIVGSVREPTDIGGWPMRTPEGIVLEPPYWARQASKLDADGWHVIIMWDEMRTITAPQQAALLKVIHENKVGDTDMPRTISHIAFANSVEDSAGGVPLEPPMANRHAFVDWVVDPQQWCSDQVMNRYKPQGHLSEGALEVLPKMRAEVASYIKYRPDSLLQMPQEEDKRDGPWASPRTWDYAAHLWAVTAEDDIRFRESLLASCVGLNEASNYIVWRESLDLLSPEDVFEGRYEVHSEGRHQVLVDASRPDRTFAVLASTVSVLAQGWTEERNESLWKALNYAADHGAGDVAASFVPDLISLGKDKDIPTNLLAKYFKPFVSLIQESVEDSYSASGGE